MSDLQAQAQQVTFYLREVTRLQNTFEVMQGEIDGLKAQLKRTTRMFDEERARSLELAEALRCVIHSDSRGEALKQATEALRRAEQ